MWLITPEERSLTGPIDARLWHPEKQVRTDASSRISQPSDKAGECIGGACSSLAPAGVELHTPQTTYLPDQKRSPTATSKPPPIYSLPLEVVGLIFEIYLAEIASQQRILSKSRRPNSTKPCHILLSLVCKAWKGIVDGHAYLWSNITIQLYHCNSTGRFLLKEDQHIGVQNVFRRLAGCPWSLHLDFRRLSGRACFASYGQPTLSRVLVGKPIDSLHLLHICGGEGLIGLGSLTLPSVESLLVERDFTMPSDPGAKTTELDLPRLPQLRKAAFVEINLGSLPSHFAWEGLTHLYIESTTTVDEMILILQNCPELEEAAFQGELIRSSPSQSLFHSSSLSRDPVSLNHLRKVQFRNSPFHLDFTGVAWPNLTHMLCASFTPVLQWQEKSWMNLQSLTHLHMSKGMDFDSTEGLIPLIDRVPIDYGHLFRDLTIDEETSRLPHLQVLGLNMEDTLLEPYAWVIDPGVSLLADMVASRGREVTQQCSALKKLVLRIHSSRWNATRGDAILYALRGFNDVPEVVVIGKEASRYQDI
ncbi:hypothetical protein NMY22_g16526 [Coprinellus aureogranulatus]|nr:hypothetical protein NMY22_g16526 [Coprinellus aureogranulatus]